MDKPYPMSGSCFPQSSFTISFERARAALSTGFVFPCNSRYKRVMPNALFLALEPGIAKLAFPLSHFLEVAFAKKMLECFFKISKGFLPAALGNIVHPGDFRLLERIQFFVQADRARCPTACRIFLLIAPQSPIIRPTGSTSMLETRGNLRLIQVQFSLVPACDFHSYRSGRLCQLRS